MSDDDLLRSVRRFDPSELGYEGRFPKVEGDWGYLRRLAMRDILAEVYTERPIVEPRQSGPFGVNVSNRWIVGYRTSTGNDMIMMVDGHLLYRGDVPIMTLYEAFASCGDCRGSSGGCPGFAPWFSHMYPRCEYVFVVVVHMDMRWAKKYAHPGVKAKFNQLSYADLITEKFARRIVSHMTSHTSWGPVGTLGIGNCYGCHPQDCTVLRGQPCVKPNKRTFSCEAAGVDCDMLHRVLYGEYLPWVYHYDIDGVQTYMSRYSMIFVDRGVDYAALMDDAIADDPYTIAAVCVDGCEVLFDADGVYLETVPSGVHAGCKQYFRTP